MEREGNKIQTYLSFIQHKNHETICTSKFVIFDEYDTGIDIKDPKLVLSKSFEMNQSQTSRDQVFMLDG